MQITELEIQRIIAIGRKDLDSVIDCYYYFEHRHYINHSSSDVWRILVADLSDVNLISLFKGLVRLERELKWNGGSVASAIWIYDVISQRRLDNDFSLADFALRNCDNPWIPFGRAYSGRRTIKDYFVYQEEKARDSAIKAERYQRILKREKGRKIKRAAAIAELRKLTSDERRHVRLDLLETFADRTPLERLQAMADDVKYPPEYYPIEWLNVSNQEIKYLPKDLIRNLYDKLSCKTKGAWKRFALVLKEFDERF